MANALFRSKDSRCGEGTGRTDHISAPTILPQQVCEEGRKEDGGKARFVLVAGMSAISGDGREREREADTQTGRGFLDKEQTKKKKC